MTPGLLRATVTDVKFTSVTIALSITDLLAKVGALMAQIPALARLFSSLARLFRKKELSEHRS